MGFQIFITGLKSDILIVCFNEKTIFDLILVRVFSKSVTDNFMKLKKLESTNPVVLCYNSCVCQGLTKIMSCLDPKTPPAFGHRHIRLYLLYIVSWVECWY